MTESPVQQAGPSERAVTADGTAIEWTHRAGTKGETWNPTTGCDRVSAGCDNCYAMTMARRLKAMGQPRYQNDGDPRTSGPGFGLTEHPDALDLPLHWRKPRTVFVNSMSDLFHGRVSREFLARVFAVMAATPQHTYQILTKRPLRARRILGHDWFGGGQQLLEATLDEATALTLYDAPWPLPNVHLGISAEDQQRADERIPYLRDTAAAVRFLSCEPLLGPIDMTGQLDGIGWVIVGGESGQGARPMLEGWAMDVVQQCQAASVPVFVKQLGSVLGGKAHHDIDTFPAGLRYREYPQAVTA